MSAKDLINNCDKLKAFQGESCFGSLSAGSIRLRIGDKSKKGNYIWIDPPWRFILESEEITRSSECPADDAEFREWCSLFSGLQDTIFEGYLELENGEFAFLFSRGFRLQLPIFPEEDLDGEYDQWYAQAEQAVGGNRS